MLAPEITAFNGQRANAAFIRQFAYISDYEVSADGALDPVISVLNYGDIIDVKPLVSADRKYVTMEVRPTSVNLDSVFTEVITAPFTIGAGNNIGFLLIGEFPIDLPNIEVSTLRSTIMLPDQGSLMLGGFRRAVREQTHSGIPFLSHIPFLGRLFSKNGVYEQNRHLMFLITVNIMDLEEARISTVIDLCRHDHAIAYDVVFNPDHL